MNKYVFLNKMTALKPYINLKDVAANCGYSEETVYKYCKDKYRAAYNPVIAQNIFETDLVLFEDKKKKLSEVNV